MTRLSDLPEDQTRRALLARHDERSRRWHARRTSRPAHWLRRRAEARCSLAEQASTMWALAVTLAAVVFIILPGLFWLVPQILSPDASTARPPAVSTPAGAFEARAGQPGER